MKYLDPLASNEAASLLPLDDFGLDMLIDEGKLPVLFLDMIGETVFKEMSVNYK